MANLKFLKGNYASLGNATIAEGQILVTKDTRELFVDVDASTRIKIGDFTVVATLAALEALDATQVPTSRLYYVEDGNILARSNGTTWVQVNKQKTADELKTFLGLGSMAYVSTVVEDNLSAELKEKINTSAEGNHSHANKDELDLITTGDVAKWNAAEKNAKDYTDEKNTAMNTRVEALEAIDHEHANKALLDTYTQTEENLADAVAKKHEHTNKEVLDGITAEKVNAWDAAEGNAKSYADGLATGIKNDIIGEIADGKTVVDIVGEAVYDDTQVKADIKTNADAIAAINNADTGILKQAKDYADGKDEAIAAAKKAGDDAAAAAKTAQDTADAKVASVAAGDASITVAGTTTAPTVAVKLDPAADNAIKLGENGLKVEIGAAPEYTIVKAENAGDYAAVYNLTKDGTIVGASINIPKDMVVESGSVVENPDGQPAGTYIELKLQNVTDPLYINVGNLIEYVTSGSATGDMVVVSVSDDHKVTATITDGTITLSKLTTEVQTAIGKAHSHENADVLNGITADKVAAWDASEKNAKDYADGLNTAMDTRVKVLEAIDHDAYIAADTTLKGEIIGTAEDASTADTINGAKKYADEKASAAQGAAEATAASALATARTEITAEIDADVKALADGQVKTNTDAIAALAGKVYTKEEVDAAVESAVSGACEWGSF